MLIREGEHRTITADIALATVLSGVAGAVNAAGFQAAGFFSANMTGNVSSLSDYVGLGQVGWSLIFSALLVTFTVGAFCSGLLIEAGRKRGLGAVYAYSISVKGILLLALGAMDVVMPQLLATGGLILGLSFVMGLQNAATTRISNARVRTTHVSGMATDVGLRLAALATAAPDKPSAVDRLKLYGSTILAFLTGGIIGGAVYLYIGGYLFLTAGLLLLIVALPQAIRARRHR